MAALSTRTIAKTLRETGGNVTNAAIRLGKKRTALSMRISRNPRLQAILNEARESWKDEVESVFRENCLDPLPQYLPARIFFLKTQCRDRGYIERSEVELSGPGGGPVITEIVIEHQAVQQIRTDCEHLDDSPTSAPAIADMPDEPANSTTDPSEPISGAPSIS